MLAAHEGAAAVPIGLVESAFGGTCIESWLSPAAQLACSNITCTSNQSWPYTADTRAACTAVPSAENSAGANAELFNGMVLPFVNMTVKGWLWYQGENNLPYMASLDEGLLSFSLPHSSLYGESIY